MVETLGNVGHEKVSSVRGKYRTPVKNRAERDISCTVAIVYEAFQITSSDLRIASCAVQSNVGNHGPQTTVSSLHARPAGVSIALEWAQ